jgi:methyl-accepting chemotaxis protein
VRIGVELHGGGTIRGKTADLSEGGMLVRAGDDASHIAPGRSWQAEDRGIGATRVRVANRRRSDCISNSSRWARLSRALERKLASIREENREIISARSMSRTTISRTLEKLVETGKLTQEDLFDNDYVAIEGTDPVQHRTRFLAAHWRTLR